MYSPQRYSVKTNAIGCQQKVIGWTQADGPLPMFALGVVEDVAADGALLALAKDEDGAWHLEALVVAIFEEGMKRGGASFELVQLLLHQSNKKGWPTLPAPVLLVFAICV